MNRAKVILIEDDELYLKVLEMRLASLGLEVLALRDGRQMEDLLKGSDISLIIMDLGLPFIDGFELIATARKVQPDLPVLAMSAQSISNIENVAMNAGADQFLPKPFELKDFLVSVKDLIIEGRPNKKMAV